MQEPRIGNSTAFMMIVFAICVDVIDFLLDLFVIGFVFDLVIDPIVAIIFGIWFGHFGVSLFRKSPGRFLGIIIVKLVPVLEMLPAWTYLVIKTVAEDRLSSAKEL